MNSLTKNESNIDQVSQSDPPITEFDKSVFVDQDAVSEIKHGSPKYKYVIVLTSGNEDGGKRATLAFSAACTAQAMELDTRVFLVGDGSHWAYQGHSSDIHHNGFPALDELLETFVSLDGEIYVCSACDTVCSTDVAEDGTMLIRRTDVQPQGLAAVLSYMVGGSSLTF